jgi:hypothetical protein
MISGQQSAPVDRDLPTGSPPRPAIGEAAAAPAPRAAAGLPQRVRAAVASARHAARARPEATRGALLAGAGAVVGALLSRRRR